MTNYNDKLYSEHSDTQTVYHENGNIKTTPAVYELEKNVAPQVAKYRATVTVQENGTIDIKADKPSQGKRYETVFETAHARVKQRAKLAKPSAVNFDIEFKFTRNDSRQLIADSLVKETLEIMSYLKQH